MHSTIEETPIMQKTRELCEALLAQPAMKSIRQRIDAFLDDEQTRSEYDDLVMKGQTLQEKQQNGEELDQAEVAEFEKQRDTLLANPVARGYLDAQEEQHELQHSITKFVKKTIELGRLPEEEDLQGGGGGGGCGSGGCGCH
ncbi:MAG: YlbF family regulator [Verrucomicrobiota bacterium]|jgi:cell fate (sporulation/competence/biofilm development) regulator YlbF (YheA/YmcA/DUF963 family)|nr:YlbF family regulator [Verrucomicrobiota bacterium]